MSKKKNISEDELFKSENVGKAKLTDKLTIVQEAKKYELEVLIKLCQRKKQNGLL